MNIRSCGITAALLLMTLMFTPITYASVSFDEDLSNDPYHIGKITYHRKLACASCPLSKTRIDTSMYKSIVQRLNKDKQLIALLSEEERSAITYYLEQLFTRR